MLYLVRTDIASGFPRYFGVLYTKYNARAMLISLLEDKSDAKTAKIVLTGKKTQSSKSLGSTNIFDW